MSEISDKKAKKIVFLSKPSNFSQDINESIIKKKQKTDDSIKNLCQEKNLKVPLIKDVNPLDYDKNTIKIRTSINSAILEKRFGTHCKLCQIRKQSEDEEKEKIKERLDFQLNLMKNLVDLIDVYKLFMNNCLSCQKMI